LYIVKSVKLLSNIGKEFTDSGKTLEELRIVDRQTIYYEVSVSLVQFRVDTFRKVKEKKKATLTLLALLLRK
jgi:hypothetical protein